MTVPNNNKNEMDVVTEPVEGTIADVEDEDEDDESKEKHPTEVLLPQRQLYDWVNILRLRDEFTSTEEKENAKKQLLQLFETENMSFNYEKYATEFNWPIDHDLLTKMKSANEESLSQLSKEIENAKEQYGDVEVKDALLKRANYYCQIGSPEAVDHFRAVMGVKAVGSGGKMDIQLTLMRLALLNGDKDLLRSAMDDINKEVAERGCDWERRNRLKVYQGVFLLSEERHFKAACDLFLDGMAAFTATELLSFEDYVQFTVLLGICTQTRPVLKTKIAKASEVLQVFAEDKPLAAFLRSFIACDYRTHTAHFVEMCRRIQRNQFMARHFKFMVRLLRLKSYEQFLYPYQSVTLPAMSCAFGVNDKFLENEITNFIETGKLNCKIDSLSRTIESTTSDPRTVLYHDIIKEGDRLLNKVQTLARVIDL